MPFVMISARRGMLSGTLLLAISLIGCEDDRPEVPPGGPPTSQAAEAAHSSPLDNESWTTKAPHGGRLLPISVDRGYVEWIHDPQQTRARLYVLDRDLNPITHVRAARLVLAGETGPREIDLEPARDTEQDKTSWIAQSELLKVPLPQGCLRFHLAGEPHRVVLPTTSGKTDAGLTPNSETGT